MKKIITLLGLIILSHFSFAQITTTKVADKKEDVSTEPYDSTLNFLGNEVYKYIGQEFYLKGKAESLRKYGYAGFSKDYTVNSLSNKMFTNVVIVTILNTMN